MISSRSLAQRLHRAVAAAVLCGTLLLSAPPASADKPALAQDQGYVALLQELQKLRTTARLMHTTAHPDDEDGGMLTLEARGKGASALLFTLTRGQGGQNKSGDAFSDELGVLRTLELLAADEYYGVEQGFSRVADFGFSKTTQETLEKWGGPQVAMQDMVRAIRTFRPDVLVARFSGTSRDGHAHHQVSALVTKEAFRAAGDPNQFPEQIKEGLLPWQPKKLYLGSFGDVSPATLSVDVGEYSPLLGVSYTQFAVEGLAHQTSQGTGGFRVPPGRRMTNYKRIDATLPASDLKEKENDFFDGINTSLTGLAARLGTEESKVPRLRLQLERMQQLVDDAARAAYTPHPSDAGPPLLAGENIARDLLAKTEQSDLSAAAKLELSTALQTKEHQFANAANLALGILLDVSVDPQGGPQQGFFRLEQTSQYAVPGQTFTLTARLYNRAAPELTPHDIALDLPQGYKSEVVKKDLKALKAGDVASVQFQITVPENAAYTAPYWGRKDPYKETLDTISNPKCQTLPLPPWPVGAHATYVLAGSGSRSSAGDEARQGVAHATAFVKYIDPVTGQGKRELAIAPAMAVSFDTTFLDVRTGSSAAIPLTVRVRSQLTKPADATARLNVPAGWKAAPASLPVHISKEGEAAELHFSVVPNSTRQSKSTLSAVVDYDGKQLSQGFDVVTRPDLDAFYYYYPATVDVTAVDVKLPPRLKVGYIMGAGDEVESALRELGLDVQTISEKELASGDLSRYQTIVIGIRAYDVRNDLRANNARLLDFVSRGGTLLVQYQKDLTAFNAGKFAPYPIALSNDRVSVEDAPFAVLEPTSPLLNSPNKIGEADYKDWVQERGLYFASEWDAHFKPILAANDPGEQPQKGGLLVAQYGKGTYIYTGLAFFRQLPAGVPGAVRLFVNLVSAGPRNNPGVNTKGTKATRGNN